MAIVKHASKKDLLDILDASEEDFATWVNTQRALCDEALQSVLKTKALAIIKELSADLFFFVDHVLNGKKLIDEIVSRS
jgi:hypothetical protein